MRIGILTVSDRAYEGIYEDESGPVLIELVREHFHQDVDLYHICPDEFGAIQRALEKWCDDAHMDLILTTGGTGFAPRDVTPEATRAAIEREAPGLVYAMIHASLQKTPHAMLSRMAAGIRGRTLIVNLPGSPRAARENFLTILPALPHALELIRGDGATEHDLEHPIDAEERERQERNVSD
ncbi:MAG: MogA/MoaB family molybdenum cofactor biosynthesis protein [Chloroflexota bacterium]|nr:MAG: MogA/MoaB family molybdenum cofactor biosynthesis protein [Chloroflexota bacterium]